MKTFNCSFTFILIFLAISLNGQDSQTRDVGNFSSISVQSGIDLHLTQDKAQSVKIVANDNVIDRIITKVEGRTLKIYLQKNYVKGRIWEKTTPMHVYVSIDELDRIYASGGSDVESTGVWKSDELHIIGSGGSDIELEIEVDNLEVECSGGSDVDIDGLAANLELNCSGGSDFNGRQLKTKKSIVRSSGGADAYIYVTDELRVRASGASDVRYSGDHPFSRLIV